jgi:hypothetical protein
MEASPEAAGLEETALPNPDRIDAEAAALLRPGAGARAVWRARELAGGLEAYKVALAVYFGTRVLLLVVAILDSVVRHQTLTHELANWDGWWYRHLATNGYPDHVIKIYGGLGQTTLGFFPLYSIVIWLGSFLTFGSPAAAGVIVSGVGGAVATVLVQKLATGWWGEHSGRRAAVLFVVFPGSVVFSMVYSEGLLLPLAAGCILALQQRRWLLAGILAGVATALGPDALVLILVCAVSALVELVRRGLRDREAYRAVIAPVLSGFGAAAFALFLWAWTGSPLASYYAQHYGWGEKTDLLAVYNLGNWLFQQLHLHNFDHPTINLNLVVGFVGVFILFGGLILLALNWRRVSIEAIVWTLGIGFLALTSEYVPPNPRLLITAFPAVIVFAHYVKRRGFVVLVAANVVFLVLLSWLTFVGITLRP